MTTTFTWSILPNTLRVKEVNGNPNTLVSADFKITASDGTNSTQILNSVEFKPVPGAPFIPFEQLTEQQVIDWIKATITAPRIAQFEQILTQRLERMKNPPVIAVAKPAPWATCVQG